MKKLAVIILLSTIILGCEQRKPLEPEPHIELGQLATFMGCDPSRSYIIIGYRELLEGKTEKVYTGQDYIVFLYINDLHDIKQGVIHKNSVIKR